jgi:hypothetical protein
MPARIARLSHLAALALLLGMAWPAAAQNEVGISSTVTASSADEIFEPFAIDEDYEEDATDVPNDLVLANAITCGVAPCAVLPPAVAEAEASAVTDWGHNDVDVYSQSWSDGSNSSYRDAADAGSSWEDALTFTSANPPVNGTVRATFRVEGSWENRACLAFGGYFYDPASESACTDFCCPCYDVAAANFVGNRSGSNCGLRSPLGDVGSFPGTFPDFDEEDGDVDVTVTVEFPLILDSPIRFGAALVANTATMSFSSLEFGVEATVESLEVPAGVEVDSEANALSNYHVPEPGAAAGAAAVVALAVLRRRAVRA